MARNAVRVRVRIGAGACRPERAARRQANAPALRLRRPAKWSDGCGGDGELEDRLTARLHQAAREVLGGSYGFFGHAFIYRTLTALDVDGAVDAKSVAQVTALVRKEIDQTGSLHLSEAQLAPVRWHLAAAANVAYQRSTRLASDAARLTADGISLDRLISPADFYLSPSADDVARVAAACRRSGVLSFTGDPSVIGQALGAAGG